MQPCLDITEFHPKPLPAQDDLPDWERAWVAPDLFDLLFGPTEPEQNTYFVVDPTQRSKITGFFDLETIDVPSKCLFQGKAEQTMAEVAPWLIDLSLPDKANAIERASNFHSTFFANHWQAGTGIFIRSAAPFKDIWSHLRKFIQYRDAQDRAYYFRFWEPSTAFDYFSHVATQPERARDLFQLKSGDWIDLIVSHSEPLARSHAIRPIRAPISAASYSVDGFQITPPEQEALMHGVLRGYAKALEADLETARFAGKPRDLEALVFACVLRMHGRGIYQIDHLRDLAQRDVLAGAPFETLDPSGQITALLDGSSPEEDKIASLQQLG